MTATLYIPLNIVPLDHVGHPMFDGPYFVTLHLPEGFKGSLHDRDALRCAYNNFLASCTDGWNENIRRDLQES